MLLIFDMGNNLCIPTYFNLFDIPHSDVYIKYCINNIWGFLIDLLQEANVYTNIVRSLKAPLAIIIVYMKPLILPLSANWNTQIDFIIARELGRQCAQMNRQK